MLKIKFVLRKVVAIAICLASSVTMFAQDIIIMKDGNEIQAVVQEVGTDDVKYKRFDNKNGPLCTQKKSEIFMIRYQNGAKDVFNEVAPAPARRQPQTSANPQNNSYGMKNNYQQQTQQLPELKYAFGNKISPYGKAKKPAYNRRFDASGGAVSAYNEWVTSPFAS